MRGGHQGVESVASSLITPPNFGGGGGSCLPLIVVVASADPKVPVTCWANAVAPVNATAPTESTSERFTADFKESTVPLSLISPSA